MLAGRRNPFDVTKAVDYSDGEIYDSWVDLDNGGFAQLVDPTSSTPQFLLGGKGTGRTHLMRWFSQPVQRLRYRNQPPHKGPLAEKYLGISLRASGLNSNRFGGKGVPAEVWKDVFAYSVDLWLSLEALRTASIAWCELDDYCAQAAAIARTIAESFDAYPGDLPDSLEQLSADMRTTRREFDLAVNNASWQRTLGDLTIRATQGRLPFAVPQAFAEHLPAVRKVTWLYMVDELENLDERQQRYIQTLVREKERPTSIIVGARAYGLRTLRTYSAGEENKEGSEFSALELDAHHLRDPTAFRQFCRRVVAKRLLMAGYVSGNEEAVAAEFDDCFVTYPQTPLRDEEVAFVLRDAGERRYFTKLRNQMREAGIPDTSHDAIIGALHVPEHPLLERLNMFLLYQRWAAGAQLTTAATDIGAEARAYLKSRDSSSEYANHLKRRRADILAKLLQEYDRRQRYLGMDTFVQAAAGLPRNLLHILKRIWIAAEFHGEEPFAPGAGPISERSQRAGLLDASEWYLPENLPLGADGERVEIAVTRIGDLLRAVYFSDKPPEVGLSTISVDERELEPEGRATLKVAAQHRVLVHIGAQRDKSKGLRRSKYQLSPMLCPRWDLPVTRRGALALARAEAEALFDPNSEHFDKLLRDRVQPLSAPFRRSNETQRSLLDT